MLDFYNIFPGSLKNIAASWKVDHLKTEFEFSKVNWNNWEDHVDEAVHYCFNDCKVLEDLLVKYNEILDSAEIKKKNFYSAT